MNVLSIDAATTAPSGFWVRIHRTLMPDYNARAAAYWWAAVLLGVAVLAATLRALHDLPVNGLLQVAAGVAIAMLAGFFPLRIPRSKNSFVAGEVFIFLLLLLHGPAAATLAAAGEGLVGSWRSSKRWSSRIASPAMASIAMYCTGSMLHLGIAAAKAHGLYNAGLLLAATMLCAVLYFVFNTLLITAVPHLKRKEWPAVREMFGSFGWIGITFAGSASIACLLFLTVQQSGIGVLMAAAPIIAMLLSTLHYFFRQQEADETVRQGRLAAIERESELASGHMRALKVSERRFHAAFTHASIGMALVGFDSKVLQANAALCLLLGFEDADPIEQRFFSEFVDRRDDQALTDHVEQLASQRVPSFTVEVRMRHRHGAEVWAAVHGSFFSEPDAASASLILQVQDITERYQAQAGLQHIAFHDSLTGLPNRRRFQDDLGRALASARHDPRRQFGLLFLDFDRFKLINDSLGHAVGDEFLNAVTRRMQDHIPASDIIARLGGDEFAILATDVDCNRYAVALAERLLDVLRKPFQIAGSEITTSASIGITFSTMGYATPADMLRDADIAMYKAKAGGKARYALFDAALHIEVAQRLRLEGDLRRALAAGDLSVAYQPILELESGRVTGFEALVRWDHPELGSIPPATFIPIAEDAALIMPLTDLVLVRACHQLKAWQQTDKMFEDLQIHVNISGSDVTHAAFVSRVTSALVESRLSAQHLTLELTENILMESLEAALPTLTELRRLGVGLSVDDFGTGYSSLRHLSSLPVNNLKIDRAFVADLQRGSNEAAVVHAIVLLGQSLGKSIIAEGIETADEMQQLRQMGCRVGQGFHLAHPQSPDRIDEMLARLCGRAESNLIPFPKKHRGRPASGDTTDFGILSCIG